MERSEPEKLDIDAGPAWEPLRHPFFRALWLATVVSNIGTWMQNTAAAWLMTSLTSSTLMIALVQTATTIPIFVLALPAGVLADIIDRRRLILMTQLWMLAIATLLGLLTLADLVSPWILLALTAMLALGSAMNAPAWLSILPELVPRSLLGEAISLNSASFNLARAVGPALGGLVVASMGPAGAFLLNAVSFLAVVAVVYRWRRSSCVEQEAVGGLGAAFRTGIHYVLDTTTLHAALARSVAFMLCGIALLALLPGLVRHELGFGAVAYGWVLGSFGAGAVVGALLQPYLRHLLRLEPMISMATVWFAVVLLVTAYGQRLMVVCLLMMNAGAAWLMVVANYHTTVQSVTPSWVRGRVLAVFLLCIFGAMAGGSALWGAVAARIGIRPTLQVAAAGLVLGLGATFRMRLPIDAGLTSGESHV
ncbi:MAG TPA: MFS transporter [Syntrophobacteraceae bacterium]|nr:MFS transporter [Syntrophobacteraceae bacterium]